MINGVHIWADKWQSNVNKYAVVSYGHQILFYFFRRQGTDNKL